MKISIPHPCSENWDEMQINGCGRFCSSCEKTVIDFTKMDDAAFITYFQNNKKISCGRFTERQLSINIPFKSRPSLPLWTMSKYVAASMIAVAGLTGKATAQNIAIVQAPSNTIETQKVISKIRNNPIIIRGKVVDENNEGFPGASIKIKNLNIGTQSDIDGFFELEIISPILNIKYYDLEIYSAGCFPVIQTINITQPPEISVKLKYDYRYLTGGPMFAITKWQRFKWWVKNNLL